jgi:hypothetical protein
LRDELAELLHRGTIRVQLPAHVSVYRSFNPMKIVSLGDGRLLHTGYLVVQLPHGQITIRGQVALEDYNRGELLFRAVSWQEREGRVVVHPPAIQIALSNVKRAL